MKVCCIQEIIYTGDAGKNKEAFFNKILSCLSDVVVLPEMWFCGFDYKNIKEHARSTPHLIEKLIDIAGNKLVIANMPEMSGDKIYNTIYMITKRGILSAYRKQFLFSPQKEDLYFACHENSIPVVEFMEFNISVATCYEIRFPEVFRSGAYLGTDVFLVPAIWPVSKKDHWLTLLKARAIENQAYVIGCSSSTVYNKEKELKCGYSSAYDPWGEQLFLLSEEPGIANCYVSKERIEEARTSIPSLNDAKDRFIISRIYTD
jgi:predicted amidohydrolase